MSRHKRNVSVISVSSDSEDEDANWTPGKKSRSGRTIKTPPSRTTPPSTGRGRGRGRPPGKGKRSLPDSYTPDLETKYELKMETDTLDTTYAKKEADDEPSIVIYGPANTCLVSTSLLELSRARNATKFGTARKACGVIHPKAPQNVAVSIPKVVIKQTRPSPAPRPAPPPKPVVARKSKIEMDFSSSASEVSFDDAILIDSD